MGCAQQGLVPRGVRRRGIRLAVALAGVLSGCTSGDPPLTLALAILPSELPAYREVVARFERESGGRVVIVPQQYADIRRALAAEAAAGRGTIDLAELDVYSLAASAADVRRLDALELGDLPAALDPAAVEGGTVDGLRFLPHRVSWQALLYNHAVLGRPPETWAELLAVARDHPGRIGMKGARYEGLTCDVLPFVWSAGGSGDDLTDRGALAAFRFFAELAPYLDPRSETFREATIAEAMARGDIVLHLNWPFAMSLYEEQGLAPESIRSAPMPAGPVGRATVLGGGYLGIPANAPHAERAAALLRFLLSRETQTHLAERLGWFSARRDVGVISSEPLAGYIEMRNEVRPRPRRSDYPRLSRAWQTAFRAVVFAGEEPEQALRAAQRGLSGERGGAP
jgi:trehalose/maltose transport system substrate-binding protein